MNTRYSRFVDTDISDIMQDLSCKLTVDDLPAIMSATEHLFSHETVQPLASSHLVDTDASPATHGIGQDSPVVDLIPKREVPKYSFPAPPPPLAPARSERKIAADASSVSHHSDSDAGRRKAKPRAKRASAAAAKSPKECPVTIALLKHDLKVRKDTEKETKSLIERVKEGVSSGIYFKFQEILDIPERNQGSGVNAGRAHTLGLLWGSVTKFRTTVIQTAEQLRSLEALYSTTKGNETVDVASEMERNELLLIAVDKQIALCRSVHKELRPDTSDGTESEDEATPTDALTPSREALPNRSRACDACSRLSAFNHKETVCCNDAWLCVRCVYESAMEREKTSRTTEYKCKVCAQLTTAIAPESPAPEGR